MNKRYDDGSVAIYQGNGLYMPEIPDESVQCFVTSPPYWGLRKYAGEQELVWGDGHCGHVWVDKEHKDTRGVEGSNLNGRIPYKEGEARINYKDGFCSLCGAWRGAYGLEPTPEMYVQHTIEILREIRRVLRKDGVVFWNIGDSYAGSGVHAEYHANPGISQAGKRHGAIATPVTSGLKPKDLCLIPFRVALAAQSDGWWIRSVIIWSKPNPMPESVTDRPTESHEYILMLTKSARYYWDADAVREPLQQSSIERLKQPTFDRQTGGPKDYGHRTNAHRSARKALCNLKEKYVRQEKWGDRYNGWSERDKSIGRNIRSVWDFPTQPYPEAHFAVFPDELPRRCIMAATPPKCCTECGAPYSRIVTAGFTSHEAETEASYPKGNKSHRLQLLRQASRAQGEEYANTRETIGWQPTCNCNAGTKPSVVLDNMAGSGTVGKVARELGREAILVDISEEYCAQAQKRVEAVSVPMAL